MNVDGVDVVLDELDLADLLNVHLCWSANIA